MMLLVALVTTVMKAGKGKGQQQRQAAAADWIQGAAALGASGHAGRGRM